MNLKIHSVDPALPPAVTSAARIAQLLALYGDDPENVEHFTVKHPGLRTPVPWTDFCFGPDPDHLARLYQRLATGTVRHPVAVLGKVTQIRTAEPTTSCRIATAIPTGLPGPLAHAEVYLRADPRRRPLLEPLAEGARVLALATQALLYACRHRALDDLREVLVGCGHRRADELLGALAEDKPSAVCRAVDRWARDTRPVRRGAAVLYGLRAFPHVTTDADRDVRPGTALMPMRAGGAGHGTLRVA